ncbi:MAG: DNA polymerase [Candidatus Aenigmatarchaeota archaeon]
MIDSRELYKNMLTPLKGKIRKFNFVGFDVETNINKDGTQEFYSGGLYWYDNGIKCRAYFSPDKDTRYTRFTGKIPEIYDYKGKKPVYQRLVDFMCARKFKNHYIVATNLGFDLTQLFWDTEYWQKIHFLKRGSDILFASYNLGKNNGKIKFIDTFNYLPASVENLGKILEKPKLDKPSFWKPIYEDDKIIDYEVPKPKNQKEKDELMTYNLRDCEISCDFAYFLQSGFNEAGGNMKTTVASTSLDTFRRGYLKNPLIKESFILKKNVKPLIFDAYYGGRTETFKRGQFKGKINCYDINSLYPSVMYDYEVPIPQSVKIPKKPSIDFIKDYEGVTKCKVKVDYMKYPILPYRKDGKLIFPIGEFIGTFNHNELRFALKKGYKIIEMYEQIYYTKSEKLFKNYIEKLYDKRQEYKSINSPMELVQKSLMNSLYGKFSQRYMTQLKLKRIKDLDDQEKEDILFGDIDERNIEIIGDYISEKINSEFDGLFSFPILSSYISSWARLRMYEYIEKNDPFYMDTDSIFTTNELKSSKKLGKMKLEYSSNNSIFIKPKMYLTNGKVKMKGVSRPSEDDFVKVLKGLELKKMRFTKLSESIKKGIKPNTKIIQAKLMGLEDNKRLWDNTFSLKLQDSKPRVIIE